MSTKFPTRERNQFLRDLNRRLSLDPRSKKITQIRDTPPLEPPAKIRRAGRRSRTWGITRTMRGYIVERDTGIQGKAPKWVIRGTAGPDDFYIAKFGKKNGRIEVLTELLNNQIGEALGFEMAHSGIARLDEHLYFITKNFRQNEALVHGSLLIVDLFAANPKDLDVIQAAAEQQFYSIDFVKDTIDSYCGQDGPSVFQQFIDMLVFDAMIGSQDRHAMNWGVLRPESTADQAAYFRLAPLFDSARALLWDLPEGKLLRLDADPEELATYVSKARPCIGPKPDHPKVNHCNHFDFMASLRSDYPHQTIEAFRRLSDKDVVAVASNLLRLYPYNRGFSQLRKRTIVKLLATRSRLLYEAIGEGGNK
jgi:hypothetical protein